MAAARRMSTRHTQISLVVNMVIPWESTKENESLFIPPLHSKQECASEHHHLCHRSQCTANGASWMLVLTPTPELPFLCSVLTCTRKASIYPKSDSGWSLYRAGPWLPNHKAAHKAAATLFLLPVFFWCHVQTVSCSFSTFFMAYGTFISTLSQLFLGYEEIWSKSFAHRHWLQQNNPAQLLGAVLCGTALLHKQGSELCPAPGLLCHLHSALHRCINWQLGNITINSVLFRLSSWLQAACLQLVENEPTVLRLVQVSIVISMHERIGLSLSHNNSRDRGHHKHKGLDAARPLMRYVCCSPLCGRDVNPARQRCLLPRAGGLCWRGCSSSTGICAHSHQDGTQPPLLPPLPFLFSTTLFWTMFSWTVTTNQSARGMFLGSSHFPLVVFAVVTMISKS